MCHIFYQKCNPNALQGGELRSPLDPPRRSCTVAEQTNEQSSEKVKERRSKYLTVRLTPSEYKNLQAEAESFGQTLSDHIREKLNRPLTRRARRKTKADCTDELLYQIKKIGNNLNQIAHYANTTKELDLEVLKSLAAIEEQLKGLL